MPEAAIDEDGDLATWERDVGDTTGLPQHFVVDPIAQTDAIHFLPQCKFGVRARLPHFRHAATDIG
jgi:hypothetical protein